MTTRHLFILGTVDDVTSCDCCGRSNLKATVALRTDDGDVLFYGRSCAARAVGRTGAKLDRAIMAADHEVRTAKVLLDQWSRYVLADGTIDALSFLQNNGAAAFRQGWGPADARRIILDTLNTQGAIAARITKAA